MRTTKRFRDLVEAEEILVLPGIFDALSARLAAEAGFQALVGGGYAATASLIGAPDIGQLGLAEMADHYRRLVDAVDIPILADADTGFGDSVNVARTVRTYERAGVAALIIEDQVAPKRCGHTEGKSVVGRDEALTRIRAAVDARDPVSGILIMARTDARACISLDEAIVRCRMFRELGADITFLEAPLNEEEMRRYCAEVEGPKMANLIEGGKTPLLLPRQLEAIGYKIAVYPLTLLNVSMQAMRGALASLARSEPAPAVMSFEDLKKAVGFPEYYAEEARYGRGT